jgi:hypothetical protein
LGLLESVVITIVSVNPPRHCPQKKTSFWWAAGSLSLAAEETTPLTKGIEERNKESLKPSKGAKSSTQPSDRACPGARVARLAPEAAKTALTAKP